MTHCGKTTESGSHARILYGTLLVTAHLLRECTDSVSDCIGALYHICINTALHTLAAATDI